MQIVRDRLVQELERPRPLTPQVLRHLASAFGVERTNAGAFLEERLGSLEEVELDLLLSPLFTPKLVDQAVFAGLLGGRPVAAAEVSAWVSQLEARPVVARLVTPEDTVHPAPLKRVTLERYVLRLRLEAAIPEPLERVIRSLPPEPDRPLLLAIARRAFWNTPDRIAVLERFLIQGYSGTDPVVSLRDAEAFLALMEGAEPSDLADVQRRLPAWEQVVRTQIASAAQPSPFLNERVQDLHGGGRDQRSGSESVRAQKQAELEFLGRLARWMRP